MSRFKLTAELLISRLEAKGIKAYIWHVATTGSIYIRFEEQRMSSVRIGDHDGREKYKYKWNLRSDIKKEFMQKEDGIWRLYFPLNAVDSLLVKLEEHAERIKSWEQPKKYSYGIPSFKRK